MLQNVSDAIRDCYRRAAECRDWAVRACHPDTRAHYLRMEDRWLKLARSYEFTGRLTDFTRELKRRAASEAAPALPLPHIECPRCGGTMRLARIEPGPAATPHADTLTLECDCRYSLQQTVETS